MTQEESVLMALLQSSCTDSGDGTIRLGASPSPSGYSAYLQTGRAKIVSGMSKVVLSEIELLRVENTDEMGRSK